MPGISQFTPSGFSAYGTYYWGGGGSGATLVTGGTGNYGRGGLGGGGGSWGNSVYPNGSGGITTNATAGMGGANTGGGGGGQWTVGGSGGGGSGIVVIAFPTFPVSTDMTPFTAVNSFASANVLNLPVGVTYGGVAVSLLQDKLLVACNAGVYCYTSANSGASWTLLSTLSTSAFRCCALSADGTKGVVSANVGQIYYVNWSTATPTMASFDATSRTYGGVSMTPDGYKITVTNSSFNLYSIWNGTTYNVLSTSDYSQNIFLLNSASSPITAITPGALSSYSAQSKVSVAVNTSQTKMLFASEGLWYATSSDAGVTWSGFTNLVTSSGGNGGASVISPDGTKGLYYGASSKLYSVNWSGGTPVVTSISTTIAFSWGSSSMTANGLIAVFGGNMSSAYYTTWNTSTSVFNTPLIFQFSGTNITAYHMAFGISQDGTTLMGDDAISNAYLGYISVSWSAATPPVPTCASNWQSLGTGTNLNLNGASLCFVGGSATTPSTYVLGQPVGDDVRVYSWDSVGKTLVWLFNITTGSILWNFNTQLAGNVLYYANVVSTNLVIQKVTVIPGSVTTGVGIALSPDGNKLLAANNSSLVCSTWNGTSWSKYSTTGPSGNAEGMCFLGGGQTGNPTNFLLASGSGTAGTLTTAYSMYLYQWDNSANALSNPQIIVNNFGSVENTGLTPGGAKGNVVYYLQNTAGSGSSCYVSTLTLNVTPLVGGFDVLNPALGVSNITFSTFNTQYCNVCCSTNGNYVYIIQTNGSGKFNLYSSSNGGLTFTLASSTTAFWYSQVVCDATGQYVWYTGNNGAPVFYSNNYGVTFTSITTNIAYSAGIAVSRDGTRVMITGQNVVAYSSNGTATTPTFTAGTQSGGQASNNVAFIASSATGQICYYQNAAGSSNMIYSSNFGQTYTSLTTPTGQATSTKSIGCDTTGQYVAYVSNANNVCYVSNNYGATWTLLNTTVIPSANLTELVLFTTSTYIYILMSGQNATPFTNNLYGGYSLISGCTNPASWTWTSIRNDMKYAGMTISDTGIVYVVGESQVLVGTFKDATVFPINNLIYDFTTASGTSTTTNGATLTSWKDARTGKSLSGGTATYNTTTTINSYPTTTSYMNLTYGNITTVQNYWTWICVLRTGGTALTGDNNMIYNSSSYALEIGLNGGNLKVCYSAIAWSVGAASVSGGSAGTWIAATNTNYILAVICRSTNNTTSSTQSYTFRINGVDYTPASNTDSRYYYINNPQIGNINSTTQTFMGEQMLFNTDMNVGSVQYIEQYLSYKWGIGLGTTTKVIASPPFTN